MLGVDESSEEDWEDFFRADYWERWILYTYPNVTKGILFMPQPEDLWFSNCQ
jgi:hypothetical protein